MPPLVMEVKSDRLLVPKEVAQAVSAGSVTQPVVKSRVQGALDRVRTLQHKHRVVNEE